jgi:hypothetical protein
MKKIKHKLKLLWLRRKWVIQCVYNTKEFREARDYLELEKELTNLYHKAKREDDKIEIAKAKGRLEVIEHIKNIEEE